MITAMEMKQHLCRLLPELGYEPSSFNDYSQSKEFTKTGMITTTVNITASQNVLVFVEHQDRAGKTQVAYCSLKDVIIGKGHTLIGSYVIQH